MALEDGFLPMLAALPTPRSTLVPLPLLKHLSAAERALGTQLFRNRSGDLLMA